MSDKIKIESIKKDSSKSEPLVVDMTGVIKNDKTSEIKNTSIKRRGLIGSRIQYDPLSFQQKASEFIEFCENEKARVQIAKTNVITGGALEIERPVPPLLERFHQFAGITARCWDKYANAKKRMKGQYTETELEMFENICEDLKEVCVSMIMEYMMLGWIDEGAARFYIINNSRYQNQSKVSIEVSEVQQPSWLDGIQKKSEQIGRSNHNDFEEVDITEIE